MAHQLMYDVKKEKEVVLENMGQSKPETGFSNFKNSIFENPYWWSEFNLFVLQKLI